MKSFVDITLLLVALFLLVLIVLLSLVYCDRTNKDGNGSITSIKPLEIFTLAEDIRDYVDSLAFIEFLILLGYEPSARNKQVITIR